MPRVDLGASSELPMFIADNAGIGVESPLSELFFFLLHNPPVAVLSSMLPSTRLFNEHAVPLNGGILPIQSIVIIEFYRRHCDVQRAAPSLLLAA